MSSEKCREAFEAALSNSYSDGKYNHIILKRSDENSDQYREKGIQNSWTVWQEAWAACREEAVRVCEALSPSANESTKDDKNIADMWIEECIDAIRGL